MPTILPWIAARLTGIALAAAPNAIRAATPVLDVTPSWLGNTFSGHPGWVASDGTVYTNVLWEANRNNVVAIRNGDDPRRNGAAVARSSVLKNAPRPMKKAFSPVHFLATMKALW